MASILSMVYKLVFTKISLVFTRTWKFYKYLVQVKKTSKYKLAFKIQFSCKIIKDEVTFAIEEK